MTVLEGLLEHEACRCMQQMAVTSLVLLCSACSQHNR